MKRMIHMILPVLLALVIFVSQPVTTLAAEELYPYQLYEAQYYAQHFEETLDLESGSYARNFYNALSRDGSFMATIQAWEAIHIATDPSYSLESGMITLRDFYRTVLFDLLCVQTTMGSVSTYVDQIYNNVNSDYNKLLVDCTKILLDKEDLSVLDLKTTKLTAEQKEILTRESGLANSAGTAETVSTILRGAKSVYDGIDLLAKYCAVRDLNDGTREVLTYIGNDSSNEYELRMAALDLVECFQGGYDQVVQAMANGTSFAVQGIVGTFVDKAWDTLVMKIPGAAQVFVAAKGVRCLVNLFGNADAKVKAFYQIKAGVLCEGALRRAMTAKKSGVNNEQGAKIYMRAVDLYKSTVLLGFDYSVEMLQTIEDSFQGIILGNSDDAGALISQINSLKNSKQSIYQRFDELVGDNYRILYGTEYDEILDVLKEPYVLRFEYDVTTKDGEPAAIITGYTGYDTDIRIPGLVNGLPVVGFEWSAFNNNDYFTSVVIPGSVGVIEDYSFMGCDSLKEVYIANGVTQIGAGAFWGCTNLETVTLPDSLTSVGKEAFRECSKLSSVTIPDSVTTIESYAFRGCSKLSSATLPSGLTRLNEGVFYQCTSLTGVTIPESVIFMGAGVFYNCSSLKEITIPSGVTWIGMSTFRYCSSLTEITIPDGVESIGNYAFEGCSGLTEIIIPDAVGSIGHYAFQGCSGLTDIVIPDGIVSLGGYAFSDCTSLTSVKLPGNIYSIGEYMFKGCTSLKSITFPEGVYEIGEYAFSGCTALESVYIATQHGFLVDTGAFEGCDALVNVYYGGSQNRWALNLYSIKEGNDSLTGATMHYYWSATCAHVFNVVTVEPTCTENGSVTHNCTACGASYVESISALDHDFVDDVCQRCGYVDFIGGPCGENLTWELDKQGTLMISGTGAMTDFDYWEGSPWLGYAITRIVLADGVTRIGSYAFCDCYYVTEIIIPESVTEIGDGAFYGCNNLIGIIIPESVTSIGREAFIYCYSLSSITIPNGVTFIDEYMFYDCSSLTSVTIPDSVTMICSHAFYNCTSLTSVIIPDRVTAIGGYAFNNCTAMTSVTIGKGLSELGNWAFQSCSGLKDVYYNGSYKNWWVIMRKSAGASYLTAATLHCAYQAEGTCGEKLTWILGNDGDLTISGTGEMTDFASENAPWCAERTLVKSLIVEEGVTGIGVYAFENCLNLTCADLPDSVKRIGHCAFFGCSKLENVTIPEGVTDVGSRAFMACYSLAEITIPSSVTSLGWSAFCNCTGLTSVTILDGVTGIEKSIFWGCTSLTEVTIPSSVTLISDSMFRNCTALTEIVIPSGVTVIDESAFNGCTGLTEITIPLSVVTVQDSVFRGCTGLTDVYYGGSQGDWKKIYFGYSNGVLGGATIHYAAAVVPTIQPLGAGLAFKDEIQYNTYFTVNNPSNVEIIEMGLLAWNSEIDGNLENAENVLPGAVEEGGILKVRSQPIPAKNMGDTVYMKVYLKLADGTCIYSELLNYSAKVYATNMLDNEKADASTKALCVAMLNYGAAAQDYFGYKTDDLMNADLTAEQRALVSGYNEDMIPALNSAETDIVCNGGFKSMTASVNFGGALGINYIFKPAKAMDGEMKLYIWTSADETLSFENASQVLTMEERAGKYTARVGSIAARNAGNTIYVCGVYESDGVQYTTGVLAYSVSAYCKALANTSGAFQPMAQAAAVYAYYANICLN